MTLKNVCGPQKYFDCRNSFRRSGASMKNILRKLPGGGQIRSRSKSKGRKVRSDDKEEKVENLETKDDLRVPKINTTDLKVDWQNWIEIKLNQILKQRNFLISWFLSLRLSDIWKKFPCPSPTKLTFTYFGHVQLFSSDKLTLVVWVHFVTTSHFQILKNIIFSDSPQHSSVLCWTWRWGWWWRSQVKNGWEAVEPDQGDGEGELEHQRVEQSLQSLSSRHPPPHGSQSSWRTTSSPWTAACHPTRASGFSVSLATYSGMYQIVSLPPAVEIFLCWPNNFFLPRCSTWHNKLIKYRDKQQR